jgi:hypothetical protein
MSLPRPSLDKKIAKNLSEDVVSLGSDYWILEGAFGKDALFISDSVKIHCEDFPVMDRAGMDLAKTLTEKEGTKPPTALRDADHKLFKNLSAALSTKKKDLTELRIKLEGPTWHNYDPEVEYKLIGNQPNPGQTGSAAPKRRKSTRTSKGCKSTDDAMTYTAGSTSKKDIAADSLLSLSRPATRGKNAKAGQDGAFTPGVSSPLAGHVVLANSVDSKDKEIAQREYS